MVKDLVYSTPYLCTSEACIKQCVAEPCYPLAKNPRMKILAFRDSIRHFEVIIGLTSSICTLCTSRFHNNMDLE